METWLLNSSLPLESLCESQSLSKWLLLIPIAALVSTWWPRSSLIHFAPSTVHVAGNACDVNSQGGATPMQAKWIKLDLLPLRLIRNFIWLCSAVFAGSNLFSANHVHMFCPACRTPDKTRKTGAFAPRRASQISLEEEVPFSLLLEMSQQGNLEPKFPSTDSMVSAVWQQGSKILVSL